MAEGMQMDQPRADRAPEPSWTPEQQATIQQWMEQRTSVWVRRSSGAWQEATILRLLDADASAVYVSWPHESKPDREQGKPVSSLDLLRWQEEHGSEGVQ